MVRDCPRRRPHRRWPACCKNRMLAVPAVCSAERRLGMKFGARNQIEGEVVEIKRGTVMCQVKVKVRTPGDHVLGHDRGIAGGPGAQGGGQGQCHREGGKCALDQIAPGRRPRRRAGNRHPARARAGAGLRKPTPTRGRFLKNPRSTAEQGHKRIDVPKVHRPVAHCNPHSGTGSWGNCCSYAAWPVSASTNGLMSPKSTAPSQFMSPGRARG